MDLKELRKEIDDFDFLTSDTDTELLKIELLYKIAELLDRGENKLVECPDCKGGYLSNGGCSCGYVPK